MGLRETWAGWSRRQHCAAIAAAAVAIYAVAGFTVAPVIVRSQAEQILRDTLGREVRISQVRIHPFWMSVEVSELSIPNGSGGTFASVGLLYVDFELSSLWHRAYTFREIRVVEPFVELEVLPDGSLAFADLIEALSSPGDEAEAAEPSGEPPALLAQSVVIEAGEIALLDRSRPTDFEHRISPIDLALSDFGTRPDDESPYRFSAATRAGEELEWEGRLSVVPFYSSGLIALKGLKPRTGWRYVQDDVLFEIASGSLDIELEYDVDARDALRASLSSGAIRMRDFQISDRESGEVPVAVPELDLLEIEGAYPEQSVRIGRIGAQGATLKMRRLEDGTLRIVRLMQGQAGSEQEPATADPEEEPATPAQSEPAADSSQPWSVVIEEVALTRTRLEFEDRSTSPNAQLVFDPIDFGLSGLSTDLELPVEVALDVGLEHGGRISVHGSVVPGTLETSLEIAIEDLELPPFEPYWTPALAVDLSRGRLGMQGALRANPNGNDEPQLAYRGSARIDGFRSLDSRLSSELLSFTALELEGIDFTLEPTSLALDRLSWRDPAVNVVLGQDGTSNLATLVRPSAAAPESEPKTPIAPTEGEVAEGDAVPVSVGVIALSDARARFEDRSVAPSFSLELTHLAGTIEGLSSDPDSQARVALEGELDATTPLTIAGSLSPLTPETALDLKLGLQNFGLTPLTPYSGRFVGQTIARGKLFLDLHYQLEGTTLAGENKVFLDQFTFGDKVESEQAVDLPVSLAVALAKDRKGEIRIDLPIRGEVDDPQFSVLGIVLDALRNLITKIALSPFSALGDLAGFDGEALRTVEFAAGASMLEAQEHAKLEALAGALAERPTLALEITGAVDPALDRAALQQAALDLELRRTRYRELQASFFADAPESVDGVVLEPEERLELLERDFEQRFGAEAEPEPVSTSETPPSEQEAREQRIATLSRRIAGAFPVESNQLRQLARQRAAAIREYLSETGGVPAERLYVLEVALDADVAGDPDEDGASVHTRLALTAR